MTDPLELCDSSATDALQLSDSSVTDPREDVSSATDPSTPHGLGDDVRGAIDPQQPPSHDGPQLVQHYLWL